MKEALGQSGFSFSPLVAKIVQQPRMRAKYEVWHFGVWEGGNKVTFDLDPGGKGKVTYAGISVERFR